MIKRLSLIVASLLCILLAVPSCAGASDDEILLALGELAPGATEMYEIVYGDSLPHGVADSSGMCVVSEAAKYRSAEEISAAMLEVFSVEYAQVLANTAFRGVSVDEGERKPKFFEQDGVLYVCPSATEDFSVPAAPDLSGAKVTKKNKYMAIVNIPLGDGEEDDIEVTLRYTSNGWRIDSPLF